MALLWGRPIGRIYTCLARPSLCPSVPYGLVTQKQKKTVENQNWCNVPHGTSKWNAKFKLKRSKVKFTGRQKSQEIAASYMFTYGRRLQTRPNPLLGLIYRRRLRQTLCNWADGTDMRTCIFCHAEMLVYGNTVVISFGQLCL